MSDSVERPGETGQPHPAADADLTQPLRHGGDTQGAGNEARHDLPAMTGYEVLEELGRGGMGVVYKARHLALDRLVALKMVLSGEFAGAVERARFRAEAQTVARLSHPNVVQVYEVGEYRGHPYLALEYVDGGSLAERLRTGPLPVRPAAELAAVLARAVQAAHDQGVIHRDLKPANVLLTSDGTPKVADFGLAKRLDMQTATQSGAVLGTPAYMAPEQASGKGKDVGPAADVYALGVVLYECLTGRPPFQAATPLDTIFQVLSAEPVPPRRLRPEVPRDLETICVCCLDKVPHKRYASAAALADDLNRWLAGEPIRARPVGRAGRLWRWCRRKPSVAALLLALVLTLVAGGGTTAYLLRTRRGGVEPDAEILMARARGHLQRKEYERALEAFDGVLRLDPSNANAHAERAGAYVGLGNPDEALADCVAAMELDPKLVSQFIGLAMAQTNRGEHDLAVVGSTAVLRVVDPQGTIRRTGPVADNSPLKVSIGHASDAYFIRSDAHVMLNHWDAAADDYARYAALWPSEPEMGVPFSDAYRLLGKGDAKGYRKVCSQAFRRAAELPAAREIYVIARMCLLSANSGVDPSASLRLAEQAVKDEASPWHLHALGLAYYRTGQYDLAIQRLKQASQTFLGEPALTPNNWLLLAMVHHRKGERAEARRWLEAAIRKPVPCIHPHERMSYQLYRREAEALLGGKVHK